MSTSLTPILTHTTNLIFKVLTRDMNASHGETFKHKPLAPGSNIRVLALEPCRDFSSDIRCQLRHLSLDDAGIPYEAVSYVWGSQTQDCKIICNNRSFHVTTNCMLALRYLRKKAVTRLLWVDAICIDQSSNSERGHQVELMGRIYRSADNVIIWLGEQHVGTERAFKRASCAYHLTRRFKKSACLVERRKPPPAFLPLLNHAWFQRLWTFQELLMARKATIQCGNCSIPWDTFIGRISLSINSERLESIWYSVHELDIAKVYWTVEAFGPRSRALLSTSSAKNQTCHDPSDQPSASDRFWLLSIASLWRQTVYRSSSEPLDRLYSLYGLLRNMGLSLPRPDYHKTDSQVIKEVTFGFIMKSRSLMPIYLFADNLCHSSACSWALELKNLEGNLTRGLDLYPISDMKFRHNFRLIFDEDRLGLEGILCGSMQTFGTSVPDIRAPLVPGINFNTGFGFLQWVKEVFEPTNAFDVCSNGQPAWEALCHALLNGYYPFRLTLSDVLKSMMITLLQLEIVRPTSLYHNALLGEGRNSHEPRKIRSLSQTELLDYIRDDFAMHYFFSHLPDSFPECSGGNLFRTSNEWIGVSMTDFQPTDMLALLHGCSVPVILRPKGEHYQLVCFASVQGIPDDAWPRNGDEKGIQSIVLI